MSIFNRFLVVALAVVALAVVSLSFSAAVMAETGSEPKFLFSSGTVWAPGEAQAMEKLFAEMAANGDVESVTITGHSDVGGSASSKQNMSTKRAKAALAVAKNTRGLNVKIKLIGAGDKLQRSERSSDNADFRAVTLRITLKENGNLWGSVKEAGGGLLGSVSNAGSQFGSNGAVNSVTNTVRDVQGLLNGIGNLFGR